MNRFSLPRDSESQTSYSSQMKIVSRMDNLRNVSEGFLSLSSESRDWNTTSGPSTWERFAPSLCASQWTENSSALLALSPEAMWMSACPLCAGQGPEWARVVQEPPYTIQIQPPDFPLGKKIVQAFLPTWPLIDWDDAWGHRQAYKRYRSTKGISSQKGAFARNQELLAASVGNLDWLHHCLKNQKDIRSDRRGFTALHLAAERGNLECMIALVDQYKFPVETTTTKGWTPLHLAINKDNPAVSLKCIQYLLQKGAPVNARNRNGITPLHLASGEGMLDCIKILVKAGADVHALDNHNRKGIDICKAWNHRECARFLKDAMWKRDKKDLAEEMGQLNQLKKRLLVMQNKYLLEKKKEKEVQNQVAFTKWLQTKPLPKIKIPEPAPTTKESARVTKECARVTKKSAPVTKESPRLRNEPPPVAKEAPSVKKCRQFTQTQPPWRPQPPSMPRTVLTPPARRRLRPLKTTKPSNPRSPLTTLRSLSPLIPSSRSRSSQSHSRPRSHRSGAHLPRSPLPPSTVRSRISTLFESSDAVSSSSRPATALYLSPSFPPSPEYYSQANRQSYPSLHPPSELTLPELQLLDGQNRTSSIPRAASPPQHLMSLLDIYLADIPLTPPPARPSSPSRWAAKWNPSTNPDARPVTQIAFPLSVRLGVHPDPVQAHDFCNFLKFSSDGEGGVHIQTADGQWVFPVPRLPIKVLLRELCPSRQHQRLKVPEGLKRLAVQDLPRRRYAGDQCFWTDSMAMSLRDTFDPAFISLMRKHQGLPSSPTSPGSSSSSSPTSSIALRQCWALLFYSLHDLPLIK
ncbi:ankyrin repeat domain-containing protein 53 [Trichosurus vulpecula]|uniref:ankyrin repeat domain-containing protein 53 n=1 Tax=Trichosurus vulpecula TaxID=9337 RepID=UPI00186B508A|nr:ankyrin repeat domain-containing protein 53 [Trichosurus vulpecula]